MNEDSQSVRDALRWLQFSEEDLDTALYLKDKSPSSPRHVCWHSQQAAEKALKAALILEDTPFPRTHDLDTLRNLLPKSWAVRDTNDDLADLTQWAEESRYPGVG